MPVKNYCVITESSGHSTWTSCKMEGDYHGCTLWFLWK